MAVILELSGQEFKKTMNNMLRTLMDKEDSIEEQIGNVSTKEPKRNARSQKHCNRNECLCWAY